MSLWLYKESKYIRRITFIRHVKKYFEWREYIWVVWWLKYFYNKEENTIKNMIKFHQGLVFPSTHFFLCPKSWKLYFYGLSRNCWDKLFLYTKTKDSEKKVYLFFDGIEFTCKIIFRTKQYKERKKRYGMDHITKMLSRTMTSESYPNLRGRIWNLWIKVALPLS